MKRSSNFISLVLALLATSFSLNALSQEAASRVFLPEDVHRIKDVGDITVSPDGEWVAYSVGTTNIE